MHHADGGFIIRVLQIKIEQAQLLDEEHTFIDNGAAGQTANVGVGAGLLKHAARHIEAAVKGNNRLSFQEAEKLIDELLTLDNPYNCPHGRPTIITMTETDLEKKFKRIV